MLHLVESGQDEHDGDGEHSQNVDSLQPSGKQSAGDQVRHHIVSSWACSEACSGSTVQVFVLLEAGLWGSHSLVVGLPFAGCGAPISWLCGSLVPGLPIRELGGRMLFGHPDRDSTHQKAMKGGKGDSK